MVSTHSFMPGFRSAFLKTVMLTMVAVGVHAVEPTAPPAGNDQFADDGVQCEGKGGEQCDKRMCDRMKKHHAKMAEELKLDEKQRKLFDAAMGSMHDVMGDKMNLRDEMKALVESDDYTEQKARELVKKHFAGMEDQMVASATAMHAFRASLTPEQREKMKQMKEDRRDNMKDRMHDRKEKRHEGHHEGHDEDKASAEHDHH